MSERRSVGFVIVLACLVAAPTAGDIGSCNGKAEPLGAPAFFAARLSMECDRCRECGFDSRACRLACDDVARSSFPQNFPAGCAPVIHDGEVCLHAIEALSCSAFGDLVSDAPIVPTECDFCPASAASGGTP